MQNQNWTNSDKTSSHFKVVFPVFGSMFRELGRFNEVNNLKKLLANTQIIAIVVHWQLRESERRCNVTTCCLKTLHIRPLFYFNAVTI